jgi:hypothetical protein
VSIQLCRKDRKTLSAKETPFLLLARFLFIGGPDPDVQHFDNGGERHRKIDVSTFDVLPDPGGDEDNTDFDKKVSTYPLAEAAPASAVFATSFVLTEGFQNDVANARTFCSSSSRI